MNRKAVLSIAVVLNLMLTGCGELYSNEEKQINYIAWLEGTWQIKNVMTWGGTPVNEGWDIVKSYIGICYDFTEPLDGELLYHVLGRHR